MPGQQPPELAKFDTQARLTAALVEAEDTFQGDLERDLKAIRSQIDPSDDIVTRPVPNAATPAVLLYQEGSVDLSTLAPAVLKYAREGVLSSIPEVRTVSSPRAAVAALLQGNAVLLIAGTRSASVLPFPSSLQPTTPQTERVVRGPHQAFTPSLPANLALLRILVQSQNLRVEYVPLTPRSEAKVALCHVAGQASPSVREEILKRLTRAEELSFVDVADLKISLVDDSWSPFVNVQLTERVDTTALGILRGRYAIFLTGSQQALLAPATFADMMTSAEDRYLPRFLADTSRLLRWVSIITALLLESTYIAITQVHQELLPTPLAFAVARSRTGVPLPVFAEVVLMAVIIEVLREAAIRLPSSLSQTISIVGALVIGQAVVQASLISAPVIVLVAIVALASFTAPQYENALIIRFLRFPAMVAAASLGLFGVASYGLLLLLHMAKLRSFGVAYLSPIAPWHTGRLPRLIRWPMKGQNPEMP
ncbi:MAG: spore germination protein [Thermaerobacter sp.]|nr:spore germination protein [Thermaerobacter sp.]